MLASPYVIITFCAPIVFTALGIWLTWEVYHGKGKSDTAVSAGIVWSMAAFFFFWAGLHP